MVFRETVSFFILLHHDGLGRTVLAGFHSVMSCPVKEKDLYCHFLRPGREVVRAWKQKGQAGFAES